MGRGGIYLAHNLFNFLNIINMKKISFIFSIAALMVLCACNRATFITPDKSQVEFTLAGGEENVSISSDGSWDITECPEWVTTEVQDSTLVVKVPVNNTGAIREGNIVLASGEVTVTIAVKQMTKCTHITPETNAVEIDKDGGAKTVNIDTDGALQVTATDGFSAAYAGGVLTVSADANEGGKRSGEITLIADEQIVTINVTQAGNICPTCNGTGKVRCSKCGGKGYYVQYHDDEDIEFGCEKCGGTGSSWGESYFSKGSGKMKCPTCGGSGS